MDIFKLVGSVMVDTNDAQNSLSKVDEKAEKTGKSFSEVAGGVGKAALGIGAAVAGVGAAAFGMAKDAAAAADEVDKGSKRMGISTKKYQELRYAAGQCGVEMSVMEKAAKKLEGTDINFDEAIESIMSLGTEEERTAAAAELFGETVAYQMAPMLAESTESYQGLIDNANQLGIIMSEDSVAAGVLMGDTMSNVQQAIGAVGAQIGSAFMPIIQQLLEWIVAHMPEIQATVQTVIEFIKGLIQELTPIIEGLAPIVEKLFQGIKLIWESVLKPVLEGILTFLNDVFAGNWEKIFQRISDFFGKIFAGLVDLAKAPINAIIDLVNRFFASFGAIDIPDWVPVIGGQTFSLPQIPRLAKGGEISGSGTVMVGEAGPELLSLPNGATVTPLGGENNMNARLEDMLTLMEQYLPLIGSNIVLDNGALVGKMAPAMDTALGKLRVQKARA